MLSKRVQFFKLFQQGHQLALWPRQSMNQNNSQVPIHQKGNTILHYEELLALALLENNAALQSIFKQVRLISQENDRLQSINKQLALQVQQLKYTIKDYQYECGALRHQQQAKDRNAELKISQLQYYRRQMESIVALSKTQSNIYSTDSQYNSLFCQYENQIQYCRNLQAQLARCRKESTILDDQYTRRYSIYSKQITDLKCFNKQIRNQYTTLLLNLESQCKSHKETSAKHKLSLQKIKIANAKIKRLQSEKKDVEKLVYQNSKKLYEAKFNKLFEDKEILNKFLHYLIEHKIIAIENKQKALNIIQQYQTLLRGEPSQLETCHRTISSNTDQD